MCQRTQFKLRFWGRVCACVCNDTGEEVCLSAALSEEVFRRLRSFCQPRFLVRMTSEFKETAAQTYL